MQKIIFKRHIATSLSFMFLLSSAMAMSPEDLDKQAGGALVQPAAGAPLQPPVGASIDEITAVTVAGSGASPLAKDEAVAGAAAVVGTEENPKDALVTVKERSLLNPFRYIIGSTYVVEQPKKKPELKVEENAAPPAAVSPSTVGKGEDVLTQEQLSALAILNQHDDPMVKTKVYELTELLIKAKLEKAAK